MFPGVCLCHENDFVLSHFAQSANNNASTTF
jgi:hypothetical protein